jgi:CheY-like chemotaxis protein/HPt (histidine-containing phosphotransfer) domain-containing protein
MPRLDGREVVRAMRLSPRLRKTRVVFLTSSVERRAARAAGVDGYLTKPVRRAQLRDEIRRVMASPDARRAASPAVVEHVSTGEGALVLVVEDQLVNQRVAVGLLERRGLLVEVAGDGRRALEMHAAHPYAAIFMDCQLPEIDGYEATAEIRRREGSGRRTPIIAMTAHALKGDRERCLEAGMDEYLSKPLRQADINTVLARMLDGEAMAAPAVEAPAAPAETPVLDRALLWDVCGANEHAVANLTDLFIDQTHDGLTRLGVAIDDADLEGVRRIAHGLKGSSLAVGALRLSAACDQLSHATSADDLAVAGEAQSLIEHVFALTRSALTSSAT